MTSAQLALEDGTLLYGDTFGASATAVFELVFNTSMTGYQEILTDPSYRGQGVVFTTSHIGNVGINPEDYESPAQQVSAVIVREISPVVSNWRARYNLPEWLARNGTPGISGIDTRFLTRKLRDQGVMKAAISTDGLNGEELVRMARAWPGLDGRDMVQEVTCQAITPWVNDAGAAWVPQRAGARPTIPLHVVLIDCGAKLNILRHLASYGLRVTIVPAYTACEQILALQPHGVLVSNGPGDPAGLPRIVATVQRLIASNTPIFGICLGHQLIGQAIGGKTMKLRFGHHSGNHPVQDVRTGKVQITVQNHNYAVSIDSLDPSVVEVTHLSLNDRTLEGMRLKGHPVFSIQYHPEASPGPHDAHGLFAEFHRSMLENHAGSPFSAEVSHAETH
jgi:carbamoyl-phosphate synthase small subunit